MNEYVRKLQNRTLNVVPVMGKENVCKECKEQSTVLFKGVCPECVYGKEQDKEVLKVS